MEMVEIDDESSKKRQKRNQSLNINVSPDMHRNSNDGLSPKCGILLKHDSEPKVGLKIEVC